MQVRATDTTGRILRELGASTDRRRLMELSERVGRAPSTVLRQLEKLQNHGKVHRVGHRKEATYGLSDHFHVDWQGVEVSGVTAEQVQMRMEWKSDAQIDWRFPLLSRVPDERGRQTVLEFLDACWRGGLFTPDGSSKGFKSTGQKEGGPQVTDNPTLPGEEIAVVVFGSCARGDAQEESDVDLLIVGPATSWGDSNAIPLDERRFQDVAAELSFTSTRSLNIVIRSTADFLGGAASFRDAVLDEGMTVFSTMGNLWLETVREERRRGGGKGAMGSESRLP